MDLNLPFTDQHHCDAAVIYCVDFRFQDINNQSIKTVFNISNYDVWTLPGVAKTIISPDETEYIQTLLEKIKKVSVGLHSIKQIIIINHADCGGYGGRQAFEGKAAETNKHKEDLIFAKEKIAHFFPDLQVRIGYTDLNEEKNQAIVKEII